MTDREMVKAQSAKHSACTAGVLAVLGVMAVTLSACNTVQGLGKDISSAGEAGERAISGDADDDGR